MVRHSVLLSKSDLSTAVQLSLLGQVLNAMWKHLFWVKQYIVQLHPAALLLFFPMAQTGHMVSFWDNFLRNGYSLKWPVWRSPLESSCTAFPAISPLTEARILFCCFQGYTWVIDFLHFPWLLYWPLINELKIPSSLCHSEFWYISIKRRRYFFLFFIQLVVSIPIFSQHRHITF